MKKLLFAILAASSLLFAESYQINTLSAKQMGMAHTGAGLKLGSESMHFNPGALGFLDKRLDVSGGVTFVIPEVQIDVQGDLTYNKHIGTPMFVYAASSITDWLSAGISFTTPYGNAADYGKNWPGANLLQSIDLKVFALQPTIAFKFLDKISIGGGPVIYFGNFELSKDLKNPALGLPAGIASMKLSGDSEVSVAANVGILYDLLPNKLALGIAYRSEAKMEVSDGKTKVSSAISNPMFSAFNAAKFKTELPMPANLNTGISFSPIEKLILAFDWQMMFWGTYEELVFTFDNPALPVTKSKKNFDNTFAYRLGAQYTLIPQLDLRLGVYLDETPVPDDYLTPESPSTNKFGSSIGFSFRPIPNWSIDASFLYSNGSGYFGRDAKSGSNAEKDDGLDARYEVQAWLPSIGMSFSF